MILVYNYTVSKWTLRRNVSWKNEKIPHGGEGGGGGGFQHWFSLIQSFRLMEFIKGISGLLNCSSPPQPPFPTHLPKKSDPPHFTFLQILQTVWILFQTTFSLEFFPTSMFYRLTLGFSLFSLFCFPLLFVLFPLILFQTTFSLEFFPTSMFYRLTLGFSLFSLFCFPLLFVLFPSSLCFVSLFSLFCLTDVLIYFTIQFWLSCSKKARGVRDGIWTASVHLFVLTQAGSASVVLHLQQGWGGILCQISPFFVVLSWVSSVSVVQHNLYFFVFVLQSFRFMYGVWQYGAHTMHTCMAVWCTHNVHLHGSRVYTQCAPAWQ